MCTAATLTTSDRYFGRNLDLEVSFGEGVTITPRNFGFEFRATAPLRSHHALIGMATVADGYPLYYDATNEHGLSMAGLNFPDNAVYFPEVAGATNITPFEFIPWILGQFESIPEVRRELEGLSLLDDSFSEQFQLSPLHWIISDGDESITVESVADGLRVYDNDVGVLTNNPTFDIQRFRLSDYMALTKDPPERRLSSSLDLDMYSRGMGAIGLPGDLSSSSRFAKACLTKLNSVSGDSESESISQFFQILGSVAQQRGCVSVGDRFEITIYSSCCNVDKGIYYYRTYENSQITGVDMHRHDLDSRELAHFELVKGQQINMQN